MRASNMGFSLHRPRTQVLECLGKKEAWHHIPLQTMLHVTNRGVTAATTMTVPALAARGALRNDPSNYIRACFELSRKQSRL